MARATSAAVTAPRSSPAAVIACGYVDVSVMPGATLTSRNHGVPWWSITRSLRDQSRSPNVVCAVTAAAAQAAATSGDTLAGAKNSVAPAV